ncbi:hypothetical protein BCR37DRAFT_376578 [Protomyces lactucae-debilis]|uniref:Uncharacterized protein n=1 Tax=Protomyces lactucae-debilis TaxID=2754530 RepID=A0A1Y2FT41_PROLT|nr:uncharacterized protein BCR37DRAFT_376578 [Protomyces lactucae-debilis]ORY87163.1 hypothetical protein BCR37DRAFT_376578 [Protomyces lactucae-debilis]
MDGFIRRQYTYRGVLPNPLMRVALVWRSSSPVRQVGSDSDDASLSDVEQVKEERHFEWTEVSLADQVRILHDLCEWHMQSEKFRERAGVSDMEMTSWRIDPIGRDSNDVVYYLLDDGRLYCRTDPCVQFAVHRKQGRGHTTDHVQRQDGEATEDWTCLATSYLEWVAFAETLVDPFGADEKRLYNVIKKQLLPDILAAEEERRLEGERIEQLRIKELLLAEALSTRKRSSRIQVIEERRHEESARAAAERHQEELEAAAKRLKMQDQGAIAYMPQPRLTREARARDRELRLYMQDKSLSGRPADLEHVALAHSPVTLPKTNSISQAAPESLCGSTRLDEEVDTEADPRQRDLGPEPVVATQEDGSTQESIDTYAPGLSVAVTAFQNREGGAKQSCPTT